jgi:hypothetical protein
MTVTIVSGRKMEVDSVYVNCAVSDLSKDHQEAIKAKCQGLKPEGRDTYLDYFLVYTWKIVDDNKERQSFIVTRKEAERLLKLQNRPCVWIRDNGDIRQFWTAYPDSDGYMSSSRWFRLGMDHEEEAPDTFYQWVVHEFYTYGSLDKTLEYFKDRLSRIDIPQRNEYCAPQKVQTFLSDEVEIISGKTERQYIEEVKVTVDAIRDYEKAIAILELWGSSWQIICMPSDEENPTDTKIIDDEGEKPLSGNNLKAWLNHHLVSQTKAAEICNVNSRTFRRWIEGKPPIPNGMLELLKIKITDNQK